MSTQSKVPKEIGIREGSRNRVWRTIIADEKAIPDFNEHLETALKNSRFNGREVMVTIDFVDKKSS